MQLLLRKVTLDAEGEAEYLDLSIEGESITIGSSPQCDIQILGADIGPVHARFVRKGKVVALLAEKRRQFVLGSATVRAANLSVNDQFIIGDQQFTCVSAPGGFDLALEWQFQAVEDHLLENAYRTRINQLHFSPRRASWMLALAVLLFAGLLPLADYYMRQYQHAAGAEPGTLSGLLSGLNRPVADVLWQSGPILPAHQIAIGDRCEACHAQAFVQVKDQACESCHGDIGDHVNILHASAGSFSGLRCQSCHKEHNEPMQIVSASDKLCQNCHGGMEPAVNRFSIDQHPQFNLSLLNPTVKEVNGRLLTEWAVSKVNIDKVLGSQELSVDTMPDNASVQNSGQEQGVQKLGVQKQGVQKQGGQPQENNHLKYPHDVHLDPKAVTHQQRGDGLRCADCHQLNADNEHFAPITMEQHCAACHDLSFDMNNPQRQLPHGEPTEVFSALSAHFVELAFNPIEKSFQRRRLPGRITLDESCKDNYICAVQLATREAEKQFLQSGCITCHEVSLSATAEGGERWQVLPVKINDDWYANAHFDHRSHLTPAEYSYQDSLTTAPIVANNSVGVDQSLVENHPPISNNQASDDPLKGQPSLDRNNSISNSDQRCLSCHQAASSSASTDILMPGKAQCTSCHGDSSDLDHFSSVGVTLNCIACHGYHRDNEILSKGLGIGNRN